MKEHETNVSSDKKIEETKEFYTRAIKTLEQNLGDLQTKQT